ncbi:hypothetical protein I302_101315 [Kwoniella bestiolae CBS 10118]|uniref:Uncharacterized protein n=1 Tax=Kwoniella bestiolae CBS 10118 TaxID=1296100 RepID=A0A1B9G7J9_9TREE|nr:hypothetical protein I302_04688 [Kwoniella bestiolae CBS 10118]OCF26996.1 hypothetical protein I302_04688 [Kwoniella bestiolae CBS 10118]
MDQPIIYSDWEDKERRADQRSVRFSSPLYVEKPPAPPMIAVKRERSPTPPPEYDDPSHPRPYKTPRHDLSYQLDIKPSISASDPRHSGQSSYFPKPAPSLDYNPNHPPTPLREHVHQATRPSSSTSIRHRARLTSPAHREARRRRTDTGDRPVIRDARNQQNRNRNTRTRINPLHDLLGSSKRVLNPDELFGSHIGQLKSEFFGRSVHETLYTEEWRDTLDTLDEGDEMMEAIKTKGLMEIGMELLKRSIADLLVVADETRLLSNHRILVTGTWKRDCIIAEWMDEIRKLGGVVCNSEEELFRIGARTYIHIVDLPGSSYIATESRYVERMEGWTVQSCIGRLVRWCNAETLRNKPLDARLEILAAQCRKDLIHDSFDSLDTSKARDRIMILAQTTSSRPSSQPNYPGEIRRLTVEDFYTYIKDIREKSSQGNGQHHMTRAERRFAKTLPPALGTDPIRM